MYAPNTILLNEMTVDASNKRHSRIMYSTIIYGNTIVLMKRRGISNDRTIYWNEVHLSNIKGSYFLITTRKDELVKMNGELSVVDTRVQELDRYSTNQNKHQSDSHSLYL